MQVTAAEAAIRRAHPSFSLASNICAVSSQVNNATKSTLMLAPFVLPFDLPHLISFVVVLCQPRMNALNSISETGKAFLQSYVLL